MSGALRIFVSAGEVSGDRILGDILRPLSARFPNLELSGLGGPCAQACGLKPLFPIHATAFNGAWDVVRNAALALRMHRSSVAAIKRCRPHLVLLVDYPGLNLRLARIARNLGVPVCFVAPPQTWAYRHPARKLRRAAESLRGCHVHTLFPFEADAFAATAARVTSGHFFRMPTGLAADGLSAGRPGDTVPSARGNRLLLCPGSRLSVLRRNLPVWLELLWPSGGGVSSGSSAGAATVPWAGLSTDAAGSAEGISILVPEHLAAVARDLVTSRLRKDPGRDILVRTHGETAFAEARHAIAFPGTVTMELALARIPTLVLAIVDPLTWALGKRLLGNSRLALPNLLAGADVFPEWTGLALGPAREIFRELERRRDAGIAWEGNLGKLARRMGPPSGAQSVCEICSTILSSTSPGPGLRGSDRWPESGQSGAKRPLNA